MARCSESLGEHERALREYGQFLDRKPADRALAEEARTSRIGLAARLVKAGQRQHAGRAHRCPRRRQQDVRYYAALQLAGLGKDLGAPAVPVLKEILAKETDDDLTERAKVALLRLDPGALAPAPPARRGRPRPRPPGPPGSGYGSTRRGRRPRRSRSTCPSPWPSSSSRACPTRRVRELEQEGIDARTFWDRLMKLGPSEILSVEGKDGERVQIWLE